MIFLQTKPQVKNMNNIYFHLYYTVIRNRDANKVVDNKYEGDNNGYFFKDVNTRNQYIRINPRETVLK